jgi:mRNA-degrading endonuclease YafQ of YafQ-DinJ toxin-antitoxin module
MKTLVWGSSFKRALKKTLRRHPDWRKRISDTLDRLATDPTNPRLETHKLFVRNPQTRVEEILLIDIGKHDEVY